MQSCTPYVTGPNPSDPAAVMMVVSVPATESGVDGPEPGYECPADDDIETDDSIADEDYVPPSQSDSSSDESSEGVFLPRGLMPDRFQIPVQSPADPDEESREIHVQSLLVSEVPGAILLIIVA